MTALLPILFLLLLGAAGLLARRLAGAQAGLQARLGDYADLSDTILRHADHTLLLDVDHQGLDALPVSAVERHDTYRTVGDLLHWLARSDPEASLSARERTIKALFQLQHALALGDEALDPPLAPHLAKLCRVEFMGRRVASVERVRRGEPVDRRRMWPVTRGTKVVQPLGVILRDAEGKVLGKAKVICG